MVRHTRAAILVKQQHDLVIDTIELPSELAAGQVLVSVSHSSICGSQLGEIDGVKGPDQWLPHLLGHEGFGEVLACGEGVSTVSVDDRVVLHWRPGSGIESATPRYCWHGEILNAGYVTTFNQHAIVSENRLTKVAEDTDPDLATLMGCAITTGFGVVANDAGLRFGESIVVFGAGGVGLNIIQAAKLCSGLPIIAVDLHENRLELARRLGATHTVNASKIDPFEAIAGILGGRQLDVFIDNTGNTKVIEQGYALIGKLGRLVLVGVPKVGDNVTLFTLPLHFGKQLIGSEGGSTIPQSDIPKYLQLFDNGLVKHELLVTSRYTLEDINSAIQEMRSGLLAGRAILDLEHKN